LSIFVDSSVWFALANARDQFNSRAKSIIRREKEHVTTDHIVVETWLLLNSRFHRHAADTFWERIRHGPVHVEHITPADMEAAWAVGEAFPDQAFSVVDRTSFAVMERLGLTRAASFDVDFAVYRYGRNRDRAFDVLR
jgi:predicted nucleic acid-binding protein